jgi:TonB family protein
MRANAGRIVFVISLFAFTLTNCVRAQQNGVPKDDDVRVIDFEDLKYPMLAQQTRTQGAVVVQAKLDDQGGVIDAVAISGSPILVPPTLNNVKKWRFRPNAQKSAIIVYNFTFLEGRCESHGSLFVLQPSNLATVIGCAPAVNP